MFNKVLTRVFGSRNERVLRQLGKSVVQINALEPQFQALSDDELRGKTEEFRRRIAEGATLEQLLVEAFATVREAARRVLGLRHYDVQLIGGMVLHSGKIAEMRTGEGKTLVGTLPVYLNALAGKGVHVVTVNDYLARRDSAWMGKVYSFLGLTVGVVWPGMEHGDKRAAYDADITYGTNNEFGFDYLRDNMALSKEQRYQRGLNYAIVDEVDSILIDEARTPLIISGPSDESPQLYVKVNRIVPQLTRQASEPKIGEPPVPGDYYVDEKQKQVHLSEEGMEHAEQLLQGEGIIGEGEGLYDAQHIQVVHHLNAALRANAIYQRDVDYIVRDGEVIIVDEFTGRTLAGRRWSDGLHQAVEAKEGVPIQRENQTLASITFQNLFRMYKKLAGMTGTADTEAYEFQSIYGLEVVVIPTHRPMVRKDEPDVIFLKSAPKYEAIVEDIKDSHERGQPVLVGTASIEMSELLAGLLQKRGVPHEVLNAKQHEREAHIVAQAGRPRAITIATNMAGRGTDIVLGGSLDAELAELGEDAPQSARDKIRAEWQKRHDEVLALGGLRIIGTERHESRRIDNQLRGRSGRQGDPGSSRFYLSLEDSLIRIFMGEGVAKLMRMFGMKENDAIQDRMVSRQIEKAQRKVEAHNFDIRKHLLEFDDTANDQRKVIYEQRNELLDSDGVAETVANIRQDVFTDVVRRFVPHDSIDEQWNIAGLQNELASSFGLDVNVQGWLDEQEEADANSVLDHVLGAADRMFREKEAMIGSEVMRGLEKHVLLSVLDNGWKEHLSSMDYLRQGIYLRGYAQKQPEQEFQREAFELFEGMLGRIKAEVVQLLARIRIRSEDEVAAMEEEQRRQADALARTMQFQHAEAADLAAAGGGGASGEDAEGQFAAALPQMPVLRDAPKIGRNDPCPCGSGKKYKQCHGKLAEPNAALRRAERLARRRRLRGGVSVTTGPLRVVAGVLRDEHDRILLAQRPPGRHLAGTWEFPGGKCEADELAVDALARELREEIGIVVESAHPLIAIPHAYPDKAIVLDVWQVTSYSGIPLSRESQRLAWVEADALDGIDMPAADRPAIAALRLPDRYLITPALGPNEGETVMSGIERACRRGIRLIQLRLPGWPLERLARLARSARNLCQTYGTRLLIHADWRLAGVLGLDGVHLPAALAAGLTERPLPADRWLGVSCHDAVELAHARRIGADFATLSPVCETPDHPQACALGWTRFSDLVAAARLPVFALGGLEADDCEDARMSGAQGIAAIRAFWRG